jgi:uncharacterized repeat protein (TIGR01451 family)
MPGDGTRAGTPANQSELVVKVTGPPTRKVGELAPFVIEITNTGTRTLHNLKVEAFCDEALGIERAEATQGFKPEKGVLVFLQPNLPPYEPKKTILPLDIHYECVKATPKAVVQVRVTSAEGTHGEGETSTVIIAVDKPVVETPGGTPALESRMQFDVTALRNPVRVGNKFSYLITVANRGTADERNVAVEAVVPNGMTVERIGTSGPSPCHIEKKVDEQKAAVESVRFDPLPILSPDKPQVYRIMVQPKTVGNYSIKASLSSENLKPPILKDHLTEVIP